MDAFIDTTAVAFAGRGVIDIIDIHVDDQIV